MNRRFTEMRYGLPQALITELCGPAAITHVSQSIDVTEEITENLGITEEGISKYYKAGVSGDPGKFRLITNLVREGIAADMARSYFDLSYGEFIVAAPDPFEQSGHPGNTKARYDMGDMESWEISSLATSGLSPYPAQAQLMPDLLLTCAVHRCVRRLMAAEPVGAVILSPGRMITNLMERTIGDNAAPFLKSEFGRIPADRILRVLRTGSVKAIRDDDPVYAHHVAEYMICTGLYHKKFIREAAKNPDAAAMLLCECPDIMDRQLELAAAGITSSKQETRERV